MTRQQTTPNNLVDVPRRTPRLRLKRKAPQSGYVDGAWWPRSNHLAEELPDLLAVLSVRLGRISRVLYNLNEWVSTPKKMVSDGHPVRLDGYRLQPADTVEVIGLGGGRVAVAVVPTRAEASDAHTAMMAAAKPKSVVTVGDLLAASPPCGEQRTLAATAVDRWESEGGTIWNPASPDPRSLSAGRPMGLVIARCLDRALRMCRLRV